MRFLILCASALFFTMFSGEEAQAKRGGGVWGTSEQMSLIAPTDIQDDTQQKLALCHLTRKTHVLFAGVWRSSIGYVLAPNNCDSDSYYNLTAERLALGKVMGDFPSDLPDQPVMSSNDIFSGFWGLGAIVILLAIAGIKAAGRSARKSKRHAEIGSLPPAALQVMDAMCHAAKADGKLDDAEVAMMADIAKQITGTTFDKARIRRMFEMAEAKPTDAQFAAFSRGLTADQRRMVLQATLMVVGSDGHMDQSERAFVQKLAQGLSINIDEVKAMLHAMVTKPA